MFVEWIDKDCGELNVKIGKIVLIGWFNWVLI